MITTTTENHFLGNHLAKYLVRLSSLNRRDEAKLINIVTALTQALESGHSCLEIGTEVRQFLLNLPVVAREGEGRGPLIISGENLYFHKMFIYEQRLAEKLVRLSREKMHFDGLSEAIDLALGSESKDNQELRNVVTSAVKNQLSIISGGPGTGKTTTVVYILLLLQNLYQNGLNIALAAPTGKAALRLSQAVRSALDRIGIDDKNRDCLPQDALTLHRLLGVHQLFSSTLYNDDNPMEWDVVVVDEASMVDLAMMSKLAFGLKQGARLILLGDRDQLASVESGAVLGDLTRGMPDHTVMLTKSYRFDEGIAALAKSVNTGNVSEAWQILQTQQYPQVGIFEGELQLFVEKRFSAYLKQAMSAGIKDYARLFEQFNTFRVLCATRQGRLGVNGINSTIENSIVTGSGEWYPGKPVMVTANDYSLQLFNGDVGICLPDIDENNVLKVWFESEEGLRGVMINRLPRYETAYAITIHKSQGSEFDDVLVVLPDSESQILSRELIYTAVTRARSSVRIFCRKEILEFSLNRRTERFTGLNERLKKIMASHNLLSQ